MTFSIKDVSGKFCQGFPRQDDCKTRKDTKYWITKQISKAEPLQTMGLHKIMNQQQQNHLFKTESSVSNGGGDECIYWRQIFSLDIVVIQTQNIFWLAWRLPN